MVRRRLGDYAALLFLSAAVVVWILVPPLRSPLRTILWFMFVLGWTGYLIAARIRERRAAAARSFPDRPVVTIDEYGRGEWLYSPRTGANEIELRLRRRRYVAVFTREETPSCRATLAEITAALDSGTDAVDVNAAFAAKLGREPFEDRGALPRNPLDRLLRIP